MLTLSPDIDADWIMYLIVKQLGWSVNVGPGLYSPTRRNLSPARPGPQYPKFSLARTRPDRAGPGRVGLQAGPTHAWLYFLPLSYSVPSLPMFPSEFCAEVNHDETRVMGLSYSEDPVIIAWVIDTVPACDRRTRTDRQADRHRDGQIYYS